MRIVVEISWTRVLDSGSVTIAVKAQSTGGVRKSRRGGFHG